MEWLDAASFVNVETIRVTGWDVTKAESIIIVIVINIVVAINVGLIGCSVNKTFNLKHLQLSAVSPLFSEPPKILQALA